MARRTLKEEIYQWLPWLYNRPLDGRGFEIGLYAHKEGWLPRDAQIALVPCLIGVVLLLPFQAITPYAANEFVIIDAGIILLSLLYFEWRMWWNSKLVFAAMLPILIVSIFTAIVYFRAFAA